MHAAAHCRLSSMLASARVPTQGTAGGPLGSQLGPAVLDV